MDGSLCARPEEEEEGGGGGAEAGRFLPLPLDATEDLLDEASRALSAAAAPPPPKGAAAFDRHNLALLMAAVLHSQSEGVREREKDGHVFLSEGEDGEVYCML